MPLAEPENVWTIVVAGGSGARFGRPKQYELIGDIRMIDRSVATAALAGTRVVVVVPEADVPADATIVCVHDAARPFATVELYQSVIGAVAAGADAVVPGVPVTDTIKIVDGQGVVASTPRRESLVAVQTPQAFRAAVLREAHRGRVEGTDDAALVEAIGCRVRVVAGQPDNRKITHPADLEWARAR